MTIYTCDPNLEIAGRSTHSLLESINRDNYFHILEQHGFADIDETAWYPLRDVLNVLNDMNKGGGAMMDFVSIGMAAAANATFPPEVETLSLSEFFLAYQKLYSRVYRNGYPGEVQVDQPENHHLVITLLNIPFPDDLMYGIFYSYARRFANGERFTVAYDNELPRKDLGGEYTVIHIKWD